MNASPRVAFLIHSFWPALSHSQVLCADTASCLVDRGFAVRVLTCKLGFDWSDQIEYRDYPVMRMASGRPALWGRSRYQQALGQRLEQDRWPDVVVVWGLGEELDFAVREFQGKDTRLLARLSDESLPVATSHSQLPRRWKSRLASCDGILVNAPSGVEYLLKQGIDRDKVHLHWDAAEPLQPFLLNDRDPVTARRTISKVHPLLDIAPNQKLAVTHSRLDDEEPFIPLIKTWQQYLRKFPTAKWVILGDGPAAQGVWNRLIHLRLNHSVVMPGWFDDWDPFLFAADVYLAADFDTGICPGLVRALSRGTPALAWRQADLVAALDRYPNDMLVQRDQLATFCEQLVRLTTDRSWRTRVQAWLEQEFSATRSWQTYGNQFESLLRPALQLEPSRGRK